MTTRELPPEEWHKLEGTELDAVWPLLTPERATVIVVEDDSGIIGCWSLITALHVEGGWVKPEYRGGMAFYRMVVAMKRLISDRGAKAVFSASVSENVSVILKKLGAKALPGQSYLWEI